VAYAAYDAVERRYYGALADDERARVARVEARVQELNDTKVPLRFRILQSDLSEATKAAAIRRVEVMCDAANGSASKATQWVEALCALPIGRYAALPVPAPVPSADGGVVAAGALAAVEPFAAAFAAFLGGVRARLDAAVYGHADAKGHVMRLLAQWIANGRSKGLVLGIHGPPGVGKTELCKAVCAELGLPFGFVPLGGASDGSYLDGHSYTYEGAMWGKIADVLMKSRCMNPVLFFDELDKVSDSRHGGDEVVNLLIHLTDPTQNDRFNDKYFMDVELDLSKCLVIFSYNDETRISPVLRDRMVRVATLPYAPADKLRIAREHLLPAILAEFALAPGAVAFDDAAVRHAIELVEEEPGVRNLRRALHDVVSHINYERMTTAGAAAGVVNVTTKQVDRFVRCGRKDAGAAHCRHMSMYA
jgi:hypothetical protein